MSKLIKRLLTFFIGIPLVLFIVFVPAYHHIVLNITVIIVSIISSCEIYNLLRAKIPMQPKLLVVTLSTCIPFSALYCALTYTDFSLTTYVFIAAFFILLVAEILSPSIKDTATNEPFAESNMKTAGSTLVLLYGGFLLTFISRMTILEHATEYLIVFLLMVFICDSAAWLCGMLFGKNNRGYIKASPNKSIAGFIGGIAGSILSGLLGIYIWPEIFIGSILKIIILGIIVAIAAIAGDLAESVFKRSAGWKDSGRVIPGRGGILDSIDSILMAAPVFYIFTILFFE